MPNGVVGLLNSAFLTQAYVGEAAWRRLRQSGDLGELSSGESANLEHRRFLVAEGEDEQRLAQLRAARVRPFVEVMYLLVANTCNLGCRYCVVQKEHAQKTTGRLMSREVVDRLFEPFFTTKGQPSCYGVVSHSATGRSSSMPSSEPASSRSSTANKSNCRPSPTGRC